MRALWATSRRSTTRVPAAVQYGMFYRASRLLRHTSYWLLRERGKNLHIENAVRELRAGVEALVDSIDAMIGGARASSTMPRCRSSGAAACPKSSRAASRGCHCSNRRSTSWRWHAASTCRWRRWRAPISNSASRSASTGCMARSTGSSSTAPGRPPRAPACATPRCARIASSPSRCCAPRREARRRAPGALERATRGEALAELEAHAHGDARRRHRGFRHAHRGRRRGAQLSSG